MVVKHKVEGFEAFVAKAEELSADKSKTLIIMFSGTKDENGKSWCPDCVVAEPVVDECLAGDWLCLNAEKKTSEDNFDFLTFQLAETM